MDNYSSALYILKEIKEEYIKRDGVCLPYIRMNNEKPDDVFKEVGITSLVFIYFMSWEEIETTNFDDAERYFLNINYRSKCLGCEFDFSSGYILKPIKWENFQERLSLIPNESTIRLQRDFKLGSHYMDISPFLEFEDLRTQWKSFLKSVPCIYLDLDKLDNIVPIKSNSKLGIKMKLLGLGDLQCCNESLRVVSQPDKNYFKINMYYDEVKMDKKQVQSVEKWFNDKIRVGLKDNKVKFSFSKLRSGKYFLKLESEDKQTISSILSNYFVESNLYDSIEYYLKEYRIIW